MLVGGSEVFGLVGRHEQAVSAVALEGVHVDVHVVDFCARTAITQLFRNTESVPIEATYVFPVDERAAVCGFEVEIDGSAARTTQSRSMLIAAR